MKINGKFGIIEIIYVPATSNAFLAEVYADGFVSKVSPAHYRAVMSNGYYIVNDTCSTPLDALAALYVHLAAKAAQHDFETAE